MVQQKNSYIIGVDEVGRGPIAGPVTVAAAMIPRGFVFSDGRPNDSKKISAKKREEWFLFAKKHPDIFYATASISPCMIDRIGISKAILIAVKRSLKKLSSTWGSNIQVEVLLDGLLRAPSHFHQKTIIKGDEIVPVISLASNIAKVTRDNTMVRFAKKYPEYGFEQHKGYGTKKHYECIKKHGITNIHRKSYLTSLF
jgi:ribonuclease HII